MEQTPVQQQQQQNQESVQQQQQNQTLVQQNQEHVQQQNQEHVQQQNQTSVQQQQHETLNNGEEVAPIDPEAGEEVQVQGEFASSAATASEEQGKKFVVMKVPKEHYEKYQFKPQVISENNIEFYNAQNISYYQRELKKPILTVWLLTHGPAEGKPAKMNYTQKRLFETAWKMNVQVKVVETPRFDLIVSQEGLQHILYNGIKIEKLPDAVLPRLGAKINYFSMAVVRQLEKMGVLVLNPQDALEISRDKLYTLQALAACNLPIPKTMIAKFPVEMESFTKEFQFPIILKKSSGSQGKGVMLIQSQEHLNDIVDMIDATKPLIFQEYISKSAGRDIRVIVVGGKAVGGMMRVAKKGFKSNFHQGGYVKPIALSPPVEWLAIECAKQVGLDVAGVDILIDNNTYRICEINSSPGFQGFEMATGVDVAKQIFEFIKLRCGVWKKQNEGKKKGPILIPVQAEHLLPSQVPKTSSEERLNELANEHGGEPTSRDDHSSDDNESVGSVSSQRSVETPVDKQEKPAAAELSPTS